MAKASQNMRFICRSCRQSIYKATNPQSRTFGSSAPRVNSIPRFEPTSSAELDALLLDWRRRVFTPAALNINHQNLVYKKSRHAFLENDPGVTVTMSDGEDVKLEPMDVFDKPNKSNSLNKLVKILSSTTETDVWAQVPAFLEGMQLAKQQVPVWFLEKLTRKANEQGKAGVIKQCAAMAKRTGFSLAFKPVTRELFLGSHMRFIEARRAGQDFGKEHKFAESLALMLESKDHCGGSLSESDIRGDMRRDLTVVGVLLEMAAAHAIQTHQARDVEGSTTNMAQKLVALSLDDILRRAEKATPRHAIEDWLPIVNGIKLTLQVNGLMVGKGRNAEMELKNSLQSRAEVLDAAIEDEAVKLRAEANGKPRRALEMLKGLKSKE